MSKKSNWLSSAGSWVPRRLELMESPAWRARSSPLIRLLERLEMEHMYHGGTANGNLGVSYNQFVDAGISRADIKRTIQLGEDLGLLRVRSNGTKRRGAMKPENRYRITYLPKGSSAPTDDWKGVSETAASQARDEYAKARK